MTIANDLISQALRLAGVSASGETPEASDAEEALVDANNMLGQWSTEDLMLWYSKIDSVPLVAGQISYDVGPTGTSLVTVRPIEITQANYRTSDGLDLPVRVVPFDSYQRLIQKTTSQTTPQIMTYQPTNPNGTILVWPTPVSGTLRILSNNLLTTIADLADDVPMPVGYDEVFVTGVALRLCVRYNRPERYAAINEQYMLAKTNVKRKNNKKNVMFFDPALIGNNLGGRYNPYSDT